MSKSNSLTLEVVEQQFTDWRSTKKTRGKIPSHLWDLVKKLLTHYKPTQIMTRLQISTSQMRRQGLLPKSTPKIVDEKVEQFVNIKSPPSSTSITQCGLTLERRDGVKLSLLNPSETQVDLFINLFLG